MPRGRPSSKARASAKAAEVALTSPKVSAKAAPTTPKVSAKAAPASPAKSPKEIVQSPANDMAFEEGDEVMAKWPGMYYVKNAFQSFP